MKNSSTRTSDLQKAPFSPNAALQENFINTITSGAFRSKEIQMTFSAQSGGSIPRVVWNWPGKTLFLFDFSSAIFSRSFDFPASLLTAPGSPMMTLESQSVEEGNLSQSFLLKF